MTATRLLTNTDWKPGQPWDDRNDSAMTPPQLILEWQTRLNSGRPVWDSPVAPIGADVPDRYDSIPEGGIAFGPSWRPTDGQRYTWHPGHGAWAVRFATAFAQRYGCRARLTLDWWPDNGHAHSRVVWSSDDAAV